MMLLTILGSLALAVKIQVTAMTKALATNSRATAPKLATALAFSTRADEHFGDDETGDVEKEYHDFDEPAVKARRATNVSEQKRPKAAFHPIEPKA
jgi:hypothetical protein